MKVIQSSSFMLVVLVVLAAPVIAATPMCNSLHATKYFNEKDVPKDGHIQVEAGANDVVVVDWSKVKMDRGLWVRVHSKEENSTVKAACLIGNVTRYSNDVSSVAYVDEAVYAEVKGFSDTNVRMHELDDQSKQRPDMVVRLDLCGSASVLLGSGSDDVQIHQHCSNGDTALGITYIEVEDQGGDDSIYVDDASDAIHDTRVSVDAGDGDDIVSIAFADDSSRAFVVGGRGEDFITTSDGDDLIYGSNVRYIDGSTDDAYIVDFHTASANFAYGSGTASLIKHIDPMTEQDKDGGTIDAGGGDDYIFGTDGTDYIHAGGGNDYVQAYGARDRIWGGSGNDELYGGDGSDDVYGENGHDFMDGGIGNDLMKGGKGEDEVRGGDGNDELYGNEDNDVLRGGNGKDTLYGGTGNDFLRGDNQNDTLDGEGDTDDCYGGSGDDVLKRCEK